MTPFSTNRFNLAAGIENLQIAQGAGADPAAAQVAVLDSIGIAQNTPGYGQVIILDIQVIPDTTAPGNYFCTVLYWINNTPGGTYPAYLTVYSNDTFSRPQ